MSAWEVFESHATVKAVRKLPAYIKEAYQLWRSIVMTQGPNGLRSIPGFRDEALKGEWEGSRSSRLSLRYRVIYTVVNSQVLVQVEAVTPHDYRR